MPKWSRSVFTLVFLVFVFAPLGAVEWVPDELLVKFKAGTSRATIDQLNAALGTAIIGTFRLDPLLFQFRVPAGGDLDSVIAAYQARAEVSYAQRNFIYRATVVPNDTRYNELWGMNNTGQTGGTPGADVRAESAWNKFTGRFSVVVADIDTGVDYSHPDLALNMWTNQGEIPGNNIDDDANGFVDDVFGYDFVNNDGDPIDDHDHGSHTTPI